MNSMKIVGYKGGGERRGEEGRGGERRGEEGEEGKREGGRNVSDWAK